MFLLSCYVNLIFPSKWVYAIVWKLRLQLYTIGVGVSRRWHIPAISCSSSVSHLLRLTGSAADFNHNTLDNSQIPHLTLQIIGATCKKGATVVNYFPRFSFNYYIRLYYYEKMNRREMDMPPRETIGIHYSRVDQRNKCAVVTAYNYML